MGRKTCLGICSWEAQSGNSGSLRLFGSESHEDPANRPYCAHGSRCGNHGGFLRAGVGHEIRNLWEQPSRSVLWGTEVEPSSGPSPFKAPCGQSHPGLCRSLFREFDPNVPGDGPSEEKWNKHRGGACLPHRGFGPHDVRLLPRSRFKPHRSGLL